MTKKAKSRGGNVSLMLQPAKLRALNEEARRRGLSRSEFVRIAIDGELSRGDERKNLEARVRQAMIDEERTRLGRAGVTYEDRTRTTTESAG